MLLKNHLIEVFKKASSENNFLLKENIVLKWVHRFGIDSLSDLLIHSPVQKENHEEENQEQITLIEENHEEENQEQITLIEENHEEENQEQIKLELSKTVENIEEKNCESNHLKISNNNQVFNIKQNSNQINQYIKTPKLPLPNIRNLRKWINDDKKAS
ncbi:MAG: glycoprotein [Prochlorococcus marinus XMU1427]|nr:glycoprotein [Prochlorococcus marinus XMU1427]